MQILFQGKEHDDYIVRWAHKGISGTIWLCGKPTKRELNLMLGRQAMEIDNRQKEKPDTAATVIEQ